MTLEEAKNIVATKDGYECFIDIEDGYLRHEYLSIAYELLMIKFGEFILNDVIISKTFGWRRYCYKGNVMLSEELYKEFLNTPHDKN